MHHVRNEDATQRSHRPAVRAAICSNVPGQAKQNISEKESWIGSQKQKAGTEKKLLIQISHSEHLSTWSRTKAQFLLEF